MYEPSEPRLSIESGGNALEMNFVHPPARFLMQDDEGNVRSALWLTEDEASVLDKMVAYILDKVKITDQSRSSLETMRPLLRKLVEARE